MITPMDIHNKTFSKKLRGYADDEVNSFLEEVASDYERIYREHREMEEQMDSLKSRLAHYEKMEATMSSTLVMAQETAENVKTTAKKEADVIVREAQNKAAQIVAGAEAARRKMNADVVKTEGDLNLYIEKLLANFTSALNIVKAAKAARAPQTIRDAAEASVAPTEAAVEAQEDTMAEEPAAEETAQAAEGAEAAQDEPEEKEATEEKND
ncbi:DivIVA domain-containing protein [Allisonella histaminiformans]|mgnify:CR=1 FL=1|uniref:DivIVA domain-containing protein n=1 Tax=Allisonella histaminiformans TaxID=209880 RepID=UPI00240A6C47|nr:DivIVA domain-containing protein [Allisonella histaminiformans]MDD6871189.1 DivIVA domain-containing protein [Allisonella histaminiformans]